jgi:enediyne biosynthesis protein E4
MFGDTFPLYKNVGSGQFEDVTVQAKLATFTSRLTGWGTGAFDFDNDGYKDLFTANAAILDNAMEVEHRPYALPNAVFRNKGAGALAFEDLSAKAGAGVSLPAAHRGAAFGDFNNDGKIDVIVTVLNGPPQLLMNRSLNQNHWIILNLIGTRSNRDGLGTRIKITTTHGSQYNHATTAVGYNSSSDKRVHFGLGESKVIDRIELAWPSGITQILTKVNADSIGFVHGD